MDSSDIKLSKLQVRKVTQDVLIFVWYKRKVISEKPASTVSHRPEISKFLDCLRVMVWIESIRNDFVWKDFLEKHFKRMTQTPYLFANYVAYASYLFIDKTTDVHVCFFNILSLLTHFTLRCWQNGCKNFLNTCLDLFCAFFDKELFTAFEQQGRWKNFYEYLTNQEIFKRFEELTHANKPSNELFNEVEYMVYLKPKTPPALNDVVLKDITRFQVESDEKAVSFADSVGATMMEVYYKSFNNILKEFLTVDLQLQDLYLGDLVAPSGIAGNRDPFSLQEVQKTLENISSDIRSEQTKDQTKESVASNALEAGDIVSLKSQESYRSPKLVKVESDKVEKAEEYNWEKYIKYFKDI